MSNNNTIPTNLLSWRTRKKNKEKWTHPTYQNPPVNTPPIPIKHTPTIPTKAVNMEVEIEGRTKDAEAAPFVGEALEDVGEGDWVARDPVASMIPAGVVIATRYAGKWRVNIRAVSQEKHNTSKKAGKTVPWEELPQWLLKYSSNSCWV